MSADFAQSETRLNLMRAFAGESQARNRYTFAAGLARRKNLYVLESVFTFTADQERAHAKVFYNLLEQVSGQNLQVDGTYPVEPTFWTTFARPSTMSTRSGTTTTRAFPEPPRRRGSRRLPTFSP